jgi:hypothetical protein
LARFAESSPHAPSLLTEENASKLNFPSEKLIVLTVSDHLAWTVDNVTTEPLSGWKTY